MKPLIFRILVGIFIAFTTITTVFTVLYWLETCPLEYFNQPFPVVTQTVEAGGTALVNIDRCNRLDKPLHYKVTRKLHNVATEQDVNLASYETDMKSGCHHDIGLPVEIPEGTPPGLYVDSGVGHYEGRTQHFAVPWSTQPFRVIAKKEK